MSKLIPDYVFSHVTDISVQFLKEKHIESIILDIDNTLARHNDPAPDLGVAEWVQELKVQGFKVLLISNNGEKRVKAFGELLHCPYIASASKPARKAYRETMEKLHTTPEKTAAVGDQIFTDVWGANRAGVTSVLVNPISPSENKFIQLKRKFENRYVKKYHRRNKEK